MVSSRGIGNHATTGGHFLSHQPKDRICEHVKNENDSTITSHAVYAWYRHKQAKQATTTATGAGRTRSELMGGVRTGRDVDKTPGHQLWHAHTHTCTHLHAHARNHTQTHARAHTHARTRTRTHSTHPRKRTHAPTHPRTHARGDAPTHAPTHPRTHAVTHHVAGLLQLQRWEEGRSTTSMRDYQTALGASHDHGKSSGRQMGGDRVKATEKQRRQQQQQRPTRQKAGSTLIAAAASSNSNSQQQQQQQQMGVAIAAATSSASNSNSSSSRWGKQHH